MHVTLYSDSAYAVQGSLPSLPRRVVRSQDRALWRRLHAVLSLRTSLGLTTDIIKCSAHGRNAEQAPHITEGNDVADAQAKLFLTSSLVMTVPLPEGDLPYTLLYRGQRITGDPRRFIRRSFERAAILHANTLTREGGILALPDGQARVFNASSLSLALNPHFLLRHGLLREMGPILGIRSESLPFPNRNRCVDPGLNTSSPPPLTASRYAIYAGPPPRTSGTCWAAQSLPHPSLL